MTRTFRSVLARPAVLLPAILLLTLGSPSPSDAEPPREIVLEPPSPPAEPLTELQKQALDAILLAGAAEVLPLLRTTDKAPFVHQFFAEGGRCYFVAVFTNSVYRTTLEWTFGHGADGLPLSANGNQGMNAGRGGGKVISRFCVDRSGPVILKTGGEISPFIHFSLGMAIGWRPETIAQHDARLRRLAAGLPEYQVEVCPIPP
jgi:hypothetical protein